jgi:hypothetical protein
MTGILFPRLVYLEFRKLLTTMSTQVFLIVVVALGSLIGGFGSLAVADGMVHVSLVAVSLNVFLALATPILGVIILASDWQHRDVTGIFLAQPRRYPVYLAKICTAVVLALALMALATLLALALAATLSLFTGRVLFMEGVFDGFPTLTAVTLVGAVMGAALGAAMLNSILAITTCFLQTLLLDPLFFLLSDFSGGWWSYLSPSSITDFFQVEPNNVVTFLTSTTTWIIAPLAIGFYRNQTRDTG